MRGIPSHGDVLRRAEVGVSGGNYRSAVRDLNDVSLFSGKLHSSDLKTLCGLVFRTWSEVRNPQGPILPKKPNGPFAPSSGKRELPKEGLEQEHELVLDLIRQIFLAGVKKEQLLHPSKGTGLEKHYSRLVEAVKW